MTAYTLDVITIDTESDLEDAREEVSTVDQADLLVVGCQTWGVIQADGNRGQMTIWPNGRGAVCYGGDSDWGDWDPEAETLTLDATDDDGDVIRVDMCGERIDLDDTAE